MCVSVRKTQPITRKCDRQPVHRHPAQERHSGTDYRTFLAGILEIMEKYTKEIDQIFI